MSLSLKNLAQRVLLVATLPGRVWVETFKIPVDLNVEATIFDAEDVVV